MFDNLILYLKFHVLGYLFYSHFRSDEGGIISLHDPDVGYINVAYLPHSIQTVIWWNSSRHD